MSLRLPCGPLKAGNLALGCLYFGDGSQKSLAAFMVFISLCLVAQICKLDAVAWEHPNLVGLVSSLLRIRTVLKASVGMGDETDNAISRIVKQNLDSKVQPVSSLAWASILASIGGDGEEFDKAIARYNNHPEVMAFEGDGSSGSISIDGRKRQASPIPCLVGLRDFNFDLA